MDKYEYNLKLDQIKSLSSEENYVGADISRNDKTGVIFVKVEE